MSICMKKIYFSYGSFYFYNLHLIQCLQKVGLHALYMLISVLFANLYISQRKGLRTNSLNEEQTFIFNLVKDFLYFSLL